MENEEVTAPITTLEHLLEMNALSSIYGEDADRAYAVLQRANKITDMIGVDIGAEEEGALRSMLERLSVALESNFEEEENERVRAGVKRALLYPVGVNFL